MELKKPFKGFKQKFIVALIGVITFLLLLEIVLRIIGVISLRITHGKFSDSTKDSYIVLCLGDSYTYGMGALQGKDYPSQLESILNFHARKRKFKVINAGVCSYNTTQILDKFREILGKNIKSDLVILLGGPANYWNYWGYQRYLKHKTFTSIVNDYLYRTRIYKLGKLLFLNLKDKIKDRLSIKKSTDFTNAGQGNNRVSEGFGQNVSELNIDFSGKDRLGIESRQNDEIDKLSEKSKELNPNDARCYEGIGWYYKDAGRYDEAIQWFKKGLEVNVNKAGCYIGIGWAYKELKQYDEAIQWFKKGIELNPNDARFYGGIGCVYRDIGQYDEAIQWFKKGIELNPNDSICYEGLGWLYIGKGDYEKAIEYGKSAIKLKPEDKNLFNLLVSGYTLSGRHQYLVVFLDELKKDNPIPKGYMDMYKKMKMNNGKNINKIDKEIEKWIISDIEKIIKICKDNKIKIIVQDYPDKYKDIFSLLYNIAKVNSVMFVSNYEKFKILSKKGLNVREYFAPDGHCNAKGYEIMARNIFDKIEQEHIFSFE